MSTSAHAMNKNPPPQCRGDAIFESPFNRRTVGTPAPGLCDPSAGSGPWVRASAIHAAQAFFRHPTDFLSAPRKSDVSARAWQRTSGILAGASETARKVQDRQSLKGEVRKYQNSYFRLRLPTTSRYSAVAAVADQRFHRLRVAFDGQHDRALFEPSALWATAGITCRAFGMA